MLGEQFTVSWHDAHTLWSSDTPLLTLQEHEDLHLHDLLERFDSRSHHLGAPSVQEPFRPCGGAVLPESIELPAQEHASHAGEVEAHELAQGGLVLAGAVCGAS